MTDLVTLGNRFRILWKPGMVHLSGERTVAGISTSLCKDKDGSFLHQKWFEVETN